MSIGIESVRSDFPILRSGLIYLDSAASSLTPEPVLQKMMEYYHDYRSNVERALYKSSQRASDEYEGARGKIAHWLNARSDSEIVITKNSTEATNLVASGLSWERGDKVVTTLLEHHSNFIVWLRLGGKHEIEVQAVHVDEKGLIDLSDVEELVDDRTKLVAITHASNALGTIVPVADISRIVHEHGALLLVDGAQSVPHLKVDVQEIGCDFLAFSGHKMCGPTGVGGLYVREEVLEDIEPQFIGGGTISNVEPNNFQLREDQKRFEAGTPPIAEAIGLGAAIDYLKSVGFERIRDHEIRLTEKIFEALTNMPNVRVYGPEPRHKVGITSFNVGDLNPHNVASALDLSANIAVRSGHHCAMPLTRGVLKQYRGTVRASTYLYNTEEEVEKFISALSKVAASNDVMVVHH